MTIESVIRQVAEEKFRKFSYVFDNWEDADAKLDKLPLPAIICVMPVSGVTFIRNGKVYDRENIAIAFLDKVSRDAEGSDNEAAYTRMKVAGAKFFDEVNRLRVFAPIGNVPYNVICERLANIVTGVLYSVEITQEIGDCLGNLSYGGTFNDYFGYTFD